jgi:hypothetical protein
VSDFDSLQPASSFLSDYDKPGCVTFLRDPHPSAEREEMDRKVRAVGGDWVPVRLERHSEPVRGGRMFGRAEPQPWVYRIPEKAAEATD